MRGFVARILTVGLAVPMALACLGVEPCFAQFGGAGGAGQRSMRGQQPPKTEVAPPSLPGTKSTPEAAAPTLSPIEMSPTEALFDAINRGDLAAARDAVNRGANLDEENILGLRPLDLSVDLGRNEISFLLLSMRGADASTRRNADRRDTDRRETGPPKAAARARIAAAPAPDTYEPLPASPRLFSGGGGSPIPAAGFVGFDAGRSVR